MEDTIEIQLTNEDQPRKLTMTCGLLTDCMYRFTNDTENEMISPDALYRPMVVQSLVYELFAPRDKDYSLTEPLTSENMNRYAQHLTVSETNKLFTWLEEHFQDFFTRRLQAMSKALQATTEEITASIPTLDGQKD